MKEHKCDICGRELTRKIKSHGYVLCDKHYKQYKKYGKFLDNNPRTIYDRNELHISNDITYIDLYDQKCNVIAQAIIDTDDIDKVKYTKWKLSSSGYVMNVSKFKGQNKHLSRVILGTTEFVDHINHNTLDNRKENLQLMTKSEHMSLHMKKRQEKAKRGNDLSIK